MLTLNPTDQLTSKSSDNLSSTSSVLKAYEEICKSYHSIDDFRMKLLGLLPLTSLLGIFGLTNQTMFGKMFDVNRSRETASDLGDLVAFISFFAAIFTLALFIYEIRGILRCSNLVKKGQNIEDSLGIKGQFCVCVEEYESKSIKGKHWRGKIIGFLNVQLAACVIYSVVFAAWIFTALKFGLGLSIFGCAFTALFVGLSIGVGTYYLVKKLIAA